MDVQCDNMRWDGISVNRNALLALLAAFAVAAVFSCRASAQDASPPATPAPDYKLLAAIATCPDMTCVESHREEVGTHKLSRIVYYEKWILLEHSKAAAEGLLRNLPQTDSEQQQMMTLAQPYDAAESKQDTAALAEIYQNWPRSIADAVLVFPQFLPAYIRYGLLARSDVHSDYTGNEERVCHADPSRFQDAFYRLDRKSQSELRKFVFNPEKCRAIFLSESE